MTKSKLFDTFIQCLSCPKTKHSLHFHQLENLSDDDQSIDGVLTTEDKTHAYVVIKGVPIFLEKSVPTDFENRYRAQLQTLGIDLSDSTTETPLSWSFSEQWKIFKETNAKKTWGFETKDRCEMFFLEVQKSKEEMQDLIVLDAGCGNGLLTEAIGSHAKIVIGFDISTSVFENADRCESDNVFFVMGDIMNPPFGDEMIDIIFSSGVIHHTPSTERAFTSLAKCAVDGGSFYVWLYRRSQAGNLFVRTMRYINSELRRVISRFPGWLQRACVHIFARLFILRHRIVNNKLELSYAEIYVNAHDHLTPRYRFFHTPNEVAEWYFKCGFEPPTLTHWDNKAGFGVVSRKYTQQETPGVNFNRGREDVLRFGL